jgi:hypothetical protein
MSADSGSDYSSDEEVEPKTPRIALGGVSQKGTTSYDQESDIHSDITLTLKLPGDKTLEKKVSVGNTIFNLKKLLADEHGFAFDKLTLTHDDKVMLDPLSLNDFPALSGKDAATIVVTVC